MAQKIDSEKYISLKEAAEISGYSSDYIGQLIRKGKIDGKQVYSNVAWMTTEGALKEYMEAGKKGNKEASEANKGFLVKLSLDNLLKSVLYGAIIVSAVFFIFLLHVFSVSFDKKMQQKAVEKVVREVSAMN